MTAVVNALNAVNVRKTIIQNMAFPRLLIPLVSALTASVVFVPSLVLVGIMMAAYGVAPDARARVAPGRALRLARPGGRRSATPPR